MGPKIRPQVSSLFMRTADHTSRQGSNGTFAVVYLAGRVGKHRQDGAYWGRSNHPTSWMVLRNCQQGRNHRVVKVTCR